jgi:hypothetical protein
MGRPPKAPEDRKVMTSVMLDPVMRDEISRLAIEDDVTMGEMIRLLLAEAIEARTRQKTKK